MRHEQRPVNLARLFDRLFTAFFLVTVPAVCLVISAFSVGVYLEDPQPWSPMVELPMVIVHVANGSDETVTVNVGWPREGVLVWSASGEREVPPGAAALTPVPLGKGFFERRATDWDQRFTEPEPFVVGLVRADGSCRHHRFRRPPHSHVRLRVRADGSAVVATGDNGWRDVPSWHREQPFAERDCWETVPPEGH